MRRRAGSRLELFYAAVIVAVMVGGSLWLDRSGVVVTAEVAARRERIIVGFEPSGDWDRYYEVLTAFERPDGLAATAVLRVSEERYDAIHAGDSLAVRYLPQLPAFARPTDRSTVSVVGELASRLAASPILAWLAVGVAALWIAARIGPVPVLAIGAGWAAAAWPVLFAPPPRETPRPLETVAIVAGTTLVERSPARLVQTRANTGRFDTRLAIPYQVVELRVPVGSGRDTVLAVDAVDSGSVAGLAPGARLPVQLDPAAPREARLAGATRRFAEANRYHFFVPVIGSTIVGSLMALAYTWRRRRPKTIQPGGGA